MDNHKHSIRKLDKDLILEARIHALQTGQTLGELINRCIDEYLSQFGDEEVWEQAA
ncbi:hypothetical protein RXV86_13005 [Alisedimentitalea sp. MJ-SS2]|uniref:hypothetical protein n=1 Tax=Aliisedimentitalea sp. MJ-SS2 TaxID=3049795 RepID=UPI00290DA1A3|nr:hypothetical protein [Alisedimentitalea sp. MJ-SS2]MDU8928308.1 hypothetical protein [Alisedimentitalea sp. MJ-SS2]